MTDTLPYRFYTDVEVFERERERLFAHTWQYAGHLGELAEPGTYFTLPTALIAARLAGLIAAGLSSPSGSTWNSAMPVATATGADVLPVRSPSSACRTS